MKEQLQRVSLMLSFKTAESRFEANELFEVLTYQYSTDIAEKTCLA
jgi:hypothetical protein